MAAEKAFIVPVVIDGTRESAALVPDKFREIQWTRVFNQNGTQVLVAQVLRLLVSGPKTEPAMRSAEAGTYGVAALQAFHCRAVLRNRSDAGHSRSCTFAGEPDEGLCRLSERWR
jgi:hypothetical protein